MYREITAKVHREAPEGTYLYVLVPKESLTGELNKLSTNGILKGELRIDDGRRITAEQRKKAYATIADIAAHTGYPPHEMKDIMKYHYMGVTGDDYFSFSKCSISTARRFISHILDFALQWDIPLMDNLLERTDDINAALYSCLMRKKCILCGLEGGLHHAEDRVGMGRDREEIIHLGMRVMCLCWEHHDEAHIIGQDTFNKTYHVYGIEANEAICKVWGLNH